MDEAQEQNTKPEAVPAKEEKAKEPKPESRMNRFLLRLMRWVLGILILAGLGALLAIYALFMPMRQKLQQSQAEVESANQRVAELEGMVEGLAPIEVKNKDLQSELDKAELHVAILSARSDIAAAQLALAQTDPARARLALSKTSETLKKLEGMLEPGKKKVATDMQSRLDLAVKGIGDNAYAAASDLDVLATSLIELENAYFAKP